MTISFEIPKDFINNGNNSIKLQKEQYTNRDIKVIIGWIGIKYLDSKLFLYMISLNIILLKLLMPIAKNK